MNKGNKNYIYQLRTKLTKAQTGKKKLKQGFKLEIKNEIKLTNRLRAKERKKE